ncbi:unnamed protein product, partial [Polarella glacialis]
MSCVLQSMATWEKKWAVHKTFKGIHAITETGSAWYEMQYNTFKMSQAGKKLKSFPVFRSGRAFNNMIKRLGWSASFKSMCVFFCNFFDPRLGSDEVEVALAWVAGELQNSGHCVYFAVLSSRLISLSRVIVRQVIGPSGSFDGLHCDGVEPLGMESVELAPGRSVDFELRMPGGLGAELHVDGVMVEAEFDGVVGGGSVQLPSSVEPQGWYWRPSGLADNSVHVNLSPSVDVPPASP